MKNSSKKIIVTVDYYYLFSLIYRNMSETLRDVVCRFIEQSLCAKFMNIEISSVIFEK